MMGHAQRSAESAIRNRGMTAEEAAALYGLSLSAFHKARREGKIPGPTLPCRRYDRVLLEKDMDQRSGINRQAPALTPLG